MKYDKYALVGIQGFLSGLHYAAITSVLQVRFINENSSIILIGCLSLISQVYLYKFVFAPFIDYYGIPIISSYFGKVRSWIMLNQVGLIVTFFLLGLLSVKKTPLLIILCASLAAIFSAFQDVSIDKHRIELLHKNEINAGSAWYLIGFRIGLIFAGSILIFFSEFYGWHLTYYLLAIIIVFGFSSNFILYKNNNTQSTHNKQYNSIFKLIFEALNDIKNLTHAYYLLIFIALYGLGDTFTLSVNNIFLLRYLKITTNELILYANTLNLVMLMLSTILARYLIQRYSLSKCLFLFGFGQLFTLSLYMLLSIIGNNKPLVITAILLEGLFGGLTATAVIILTSYIVKKPYIATQYALLASLAAIKTVILGPLSAVVVVWLNWTKLYLIGMCLTLPSLWLIYFLQNYFHEISKNGIKNITNDISSIEFNPTLM